MKKFTQCLNSKTGILVVSGAIILALLVALVGQGMGWGASGLAGTAGYLSAACSIAPLDSGEKAGFVTADYLNLRASPSLQAQVVTLLPLCQKVLLVGRTGDSGWLEVQLPSGSASGWVYALYIQPSVRVSSLPITAARGGPTHRASSTKPSSTTGSTSTSGSSTGGYTTIYIDGGSGAAFVRGMPANSSVTLSLGPANAAGKAVTVAQGTVGSDGSATIPFAMPTTWADGSTVRESDLLLVVRAADGTTKSVPLKYYAS